MNRLMSFPTWQEAREAKRLLEIVYSGDDFFVALIFSQPGVYEGTFEEGGRAMRMRDLEIASDEIVYT